MEAATLDIELFALCRLAEAGVPPALRVELAATLPTPASAFAAARLVEAGVPPDVLLDACRVGADLGLVVAVLDQLAAGGA